MHKVVEVTSPRILGVERLVPNLDSGRVRIGLRRREFCHIGVCA